MFIAASGPKNLSPVGAVCVDTATKCYENIAKLTPMVWFGTAPPPGPVGAVWNRTAFEKENSKIETIRQFI